MFDNVGCILIRGMLSMLLQGLCLGLPRSVRSRFIQNRFHICHRRLFLVSHRPIGLVDILVVVKESVLNVESETTDGLVRRYFPGASRSRVGEGVSVGLSRAGLLVASASHVRHCCPLILKQVELRFRSGMVRGCMITHMGVPKWIDVFHCSLKYNKSV
jgi:hypothetical protein